MKRSPWTEEDNATMKGLAGKIPASNIAERLGQRGCASGAGLEAKISLRSEPNKTRPDVTTNSRDPQSEGLTSRVGQ